MTIAGVNTATAGAGGSIATAVTGEHSFPAVLSRKRWHFSPKVLNQVIK
jgi:hypothetical protein